jgi:hypothetical protein
MANMLSDGVALMVASLLDNAGSAVTYTATVSGSTLAVEMFQGPEKPTIVQVGSEVVEMIMTDFVGASADFVGDPVRGDRITVGSGAIYEVRPMGSSKPYYRTLGQIRIHTQQIK